MPLSPRSCSGSLLRALPLRPAAAQHPVHHHARLRLRRRALHGRDLRPRRARPQHRRRVCRPARPRLRRLLRRRRLHRRRPQLRARLPAVAAGASRSRSSSRCLGRHARRPDPAGARRLPRDRHARLRRDRPPHARQLAWLGGPQGITDIPRPPGVELVRDPEHRLEHRRAASSTSTTTTTFLKFGIIDFDPVLLAGARRHRPRAGLRHRLVKNSRVGRAWEATREDEDAAELMGVPTFRFKLSPSPSAPPSAAWPGRCSPASRASSTRRASSCSCRSSSSPPSSSAARATAGASSSVRSSWPTSRSASGSSPTAACSSSALALMVLAIFRPQGLLPPRRTVRAKRADARQQSRGRRGQCLTDEPGTVADEPPARRTHDLGPDRASPRSTPTRHHARGHRRAVVPRASAARGRRRHAAVRWRRRPRRGLLPHQRGRDPRPHRARTAPARPRAST